MKCLLKTKTCSTFSDFASSIPENNFERPRTAAMLKSMPNTGAGGGDIEEEEDYGGCYDLLPE